MIEPPEPIKPKLRRDLGWIAQTDARTWVVEDPVSAKFFILSDVEQIAASYMNGSRSLAEITVELCQRFPSLAIDQAWVVTLFAKLQSLNLLVANSASDAKRLFAGRRTAKSRGIVGQLLSPLAIRIPMFDPSSLLATLKRPAGLLFHPAVVVLWLFFGLIAFYFVLRQLLIGHFDLAAELRALSGERILLLGVSYVVAKSLHELGHALACTYHRTQCNEMGVMLLCLAPCLYCDTTDSWRLPSKWRRAGIAAAGMYVEFILATLAAGLWLFTVHGAMHDIAGSVMVICSVGTIFVNSNPLLRYDGYFILSDLWGVPNLAERSRAAMQTLLATWLTGQRPDSREFPNNIWLLAGYGVASGVYRLFVLGLILWICWQVSVPMGLGFIAIFVSFSVLLGVGLSQVRSARSLWKAVKARGQVRAVRFLAGVGLLAASVYFACQIPLPCSILRAASPTTRTRFRSSPTERLKLPMSRQSDKLLRKARQFWNFAVPRVNWSWLHCKVRSGKYGKSCNSSKNAEPLTPWLNIRSLPGRRR